MPDYRLPSGSGWGGTAKNTQAWCIQKCDLGPNLSAVPDYNLKNPTHTIVSPARTMPIHTYQQALANTRQQWKLALME